MADDVLRPAAFVGGRHEANAEGLLGRFAELMPVGPIVEIPNAGREALGLAQAPSRLLWTIDLGRLFERLLVDADVGSKARLFRAFAAAVKRDVPEAADYLEAWGSK